MKFESNSQREIYDYFPKITYFTWNSAASKNPNFLISYLQKYSEPRSEIQSRGSSRFWFKTIFILASEAAPKKCYNKNATMAYLKPQHPN